MNAYFKKLVHSLGLMLVILGIVVTGISVYHLHDDATTDWREADARVTGYDPFVKRGATAGWSYIPCVHFEFMIGDQVHQGRVCGGGFGGYQSSEAEGREAGRIRYGEVHTIWYDPTDPSRSRLSESVMGRAIFFAFAGLLLIGVGIVSRVKVKPEE